MSNRMHVELLLGGVEKWNQWRKANAGTIPDLSGATLHNTPLRTANLGRTNLESATLDNSDLSRADLGGARLRGASLKRTNLSDADLSDADLRDADLSGATLFKADLHAARLEAATLHHASLRQANLQGAHLSGVDLAEADLRGADLRGANLSGANLGSAKLILANLSDANLTGAKLPGAILRQANLTNTKLDDAVLSHTDLTQAQLIGTSLRGTQLADCKVYGISTWDLMLENAAQTNLRITPDSDTEEITSDDLEVAQFLYLMLHNDKLRRVIDTITSKVVLILGRFTPERKQVLDAIRNALRAHPHHYVPVLFDFEEPRTRSKTQTISWLAKMARFVIADLTEPASVGYELKVIVPEAHVPVQAILLDGVNTFALAGDLWQDHPSLMLPLYRYSTLDQLLMTLSDRVIAPAEARAHELERQRALLVDGLS